MNRTSEELGASLSSLDQRPACVLEGVCENERRKSSPRAEVNNVSNKHRVWGARKSNKPHGVFAMGFAFTTKLTRSNPLQQHIFGRTHALCVSEWANNHSPSRLFTLRASLDAVDLVHGVVHDFAVSGPHWLE